MLSGLIWWLVVGGIAGWLAGKVMKGGGFGVGMDIVIGIVGSVVAPSRQPADFCQNGSSADR